MNKRQLIEAIRTYNASASVMFLTQFDESSLQQYLQHLEDAKSKKRQINSWSRQRDKMKMVS